MKNLLKIGKALSKAEQKRISGGATSGGVTTLLCGFGDSGYCTDESDCFDPYNGHPFVQWVCVNYCCGLGY